MVDSPQSIPIQATETPAAVISASGMAPIAAHAATTFESAVTAHASADQLWDDQDVAPVVFELSSQPESFDQVEQMAGPQSDQAAMASTVATRIRANSLLDDPVAVWYVRPPSGGQYGPASGDMLRTWIQEARVTNTSLIWRDGWAQWRTANEVLTEFGAGEPAANTPVTNGASAQPSARGARLSDAETPALSGDNSIGKTKSKRTGNRFVMIGTLAALSMTLIGILIYLFQR